jgi:Zn-dependent M28 family amino/carboxypeptidase
MKRFGILLSISLFVFSIVQAQMPIEDELYAYVLGIEGRSHLDRGEFIKEQLNKLEVGYFTAPFKNISRVKGDTVIIEGKNIIARLGKGTKHIVVGAHYDAVTISPGANDNGSGVAVLLALIQHLQNMEWNYSVDFCFFDYEESKLMGSMYYVNQFVIPQKHVAMINLDIEGTGEEVYVGPVGRNNRFLLRYVHEAAQKNGFPLVENSDYPESDYESFAQYRLENISVSVVPKGDGERLSKFVHNGYKADSINMPKVLGVMHTANDRSNLISPASLKMSYEFTRTLLVLLNKSRK